MGDVICFGFIIDAWHISDPETPIICGTPFRPGSYPGLFHDILSGSAAPSLLSSALISRRLARHPVCPTSAIRLPYRRSKDATIRGVDENDPHSSIDLHGLRTVGSYHSLRRFHSPLHNLPRPFSTTYKFATI
ncbi:hypothetical protein Agabi119p4_2424 [Agaricus bisporus var. burnettii]|uniref:Uncharacterized protein n=1 Tax=Agaricus bisporus var. burnettii TaxID=192524 RepID=A0A8H7KK96_AGABI|nr:hypothetical protein Agabi119p4_2424 [Agaricus bisporus var. burnettii]